jgi:hypothetical protein
MFRVQNMECAVLITAHHTLRNANNYILFFVSFGECLC